VTPVFVLKKSMHKYNCYVYVSKYMTFQLSSTVIVYGKKNSGDK